MKRINYVCRTMVMAIILSFVILINTKAAEETQPLIKSEFNISPENKEKINMLLEEKPDAIEYINNSIEVFDESVYGTDGEFNEFLSEVIEAAILVKEKQDRDIEIANRQDVGFTSFPNSRSAASDLAYAAYDKGIKMVRDRGCAQTAKYMEHAKNIVGQSGNGHYYHYYDSWAKSCALNGELFSKIESQFESQILATNKSVGVVTGDFSYTTSNSSLDHYTALHNVHYAVTFTKNSIGYEAAYDIGDIYDFAWGNYDNIEVGFGNNYCKMMQELGLIRRFGIDIYYKY